MWGYRFFMQAIGLYIVLAALGLELVAKQPRRSAQVVAALGGALAVGLLAVGQWRHLPEPKYAATERSLTTSVHFEVAAYVKSLGVRPDDTIVLSEAGIVPYELGDVRIADFLGLVSRREDVFRSLGEGEWTFDPAYLLRDKPRFVLLTEVEERNGTRRGRMSFEALLLKYPEFEHDYERRKDFAMTHATDLNERRYYYFEPSAARVWFALFERRSSN
jgi:hypothetical protein